MKTEPGAIYVADTTALALMWLANGLLALAGVAHYTVLWVPSYNLCHSPEAAEDQGIIRVCHRRMFQYTSRAGLKMMLALYCLLRAHIVWDVVEPPVRDEQWAAVLVIMAVLTWLTVDTLVGRHYD